MIKRIIGVAFTLATLAVVVFAALNYNNYKSMLFERDLYEMLFARSSVSETTEEPAKEPVNEDVIEAEEPISEETEGAI